MSITEYYFQGLRHGCRSPECNIELNLMNINTELRRGCGLPNCNIGFDYNIYLEYVSLRNHKRAVRPKGARANELYMMNRIELTDSSLSSELQCSCTIQIFQLLNQFVGAQFSSNARCR